MKKDVKMLLDSTSLLYTLTNGKKSFSIGFLPLKSLIFLEAFPDSGTTTLQYTSLCMQNGGSLFR